MIDWKLAPEGADTLRQVDNFGYLRWFNGKGRAWDGHKWFRTDEGYKTIATRQQPQQPRKTVKDAVERYGQWKDRYHAKLAFSDSLKWIYYSHEEQLAKDEHHVCTREEFEACVAAKAKSEPEWTHLVNGSECVLLDPDKDCDGYYITKTHYGSFELAKEHELKPIKPTISKAEAWDMCRESHERRVDGLAVISDKIAWVIENHDII